MTILLMSLEAQSKSLGAQIKKSELMDDPTLQKILHFFTSVPTFGVKDWLINEKCGLNETILHFIPFGFIIIRSGLNH